MRYIIDAKTGFVDEGGYVEFYNIHNQKILGFKQFSNKNRAINAWKKQKLLSKYNLAPKVFSKICKIPIVSNYWQENSNWGFITEKALLVNEKTMKSRINEIQTLVETIYKKTGFKFWDCHYYNIGYVKRNNKSKLVCIDTGNESFFRDCNAWGFNFPGPRCDQCYSFNCSCDSF